VCEDNNKQAQKQNHSKPGTLVEDSTVVGGRDAESGADVIRPKTVEGTADESTEATDPREQKRRGGGT